MMVEFVGGPRDGELEELPDRTHEIKVHLGPGVRTTVKGPTRTMAEVTEMARQLSAAPLMLRTGRYCRKDGGLYLGPTPFVWQGED